MTIYQRMMYLGLSITLACTLVIANFVFIDSSGSKIPETSETKALVQDMDIYNTRILKKLFPYKEVEITHDVPGNMSYSPLDFQKFITNGTYLTENKISDSEKDAYLSKAVFAGDSLTYHMGRASDVLGQYDVVAYPGVTVRGYLDQKDYADSNQYPMYNQNKNTSVQQKASYWLGQLKPDVIYIMLGTNGLTTYTVDQHITYYEALLKNIKSILPSAKIVICAISPLGSSWSSSSNTPENVNKSKVIPYNMALLELADKLGYYFLNGAEIMYDSDGYFKSEYHTTDGLHWTNKARQDYLKYVLSHAVPGL